MIKQALTTAALGALLAAGLVQLQAQTLGMPETYSFTARSDMVWPKSTHTVNRNGSMELVEIKNDSGDFHLVQLYDFQAHKVYTRDLNAGSCTAQEYVSPYAPVPHDPIGGWEEMRRAMAGNPPKYVRTESVNGLRAKVVELVFPDGEGKFTYWLDEKFGFPMKHTATLRNQPERLLMEMRQLSYAPSPASLFTAPAQCTRVAGVTSSTGGHVETQVEASVSATQELGQTDAAASTPVRGKVTAVRLRLVPERYSGPCPSPVKLVADITTDGPATVWYEFLAGAVKKRGPGEGTVSFDGAGTRQLVLEAEYVMTPGVPGCSLIAAPVNEDGSHGPQTVSSGLAHFNATCGARVPAARK
jgi:hypothetical protein